MKSLSLLLCFVLLHTALSLLTKRRELVAAGRRRPINTCDLPSLPNGKVMRRQRGKMLQYVCNAPFKIIGSKYATCINRRWDSPVPFCAKVGCPEISTAEFKDHMVFYENSNVMVTLRCRSEYILKGASVAYCDGEAWDRALGSCHPTAGIDNLSCDFESEELCGWSHDENEDFRWARRSGLPLTLRQRTGPRTDHTIGVLHEGHYMLLESYEHEEGDRALFFSPIYSAEKSKDACLRFFYHMYGLLVGSLRVYVKPVSLDLDLLYAEPKYRFFDKKGNQRNIWHEGRFLLEEVSESFQIIFEGVLRSSLFGDIAIDDVELLQGEECLPDPILTTTPEVVLVEAEDNFATILSCENRCGEQGKTNQTDSCDCHNECSDSYSCCPDFGKVCLSSDALPTSTSTRKTTTAPPPKQSTTKATTTVRAPTTPMTQKSRRPTLVVAVPKSQTTRKPTSMRTSEFVEPVTSIKILPIALDNELPQGLDVVSMHKTAIFISIVGCLCLGLIVIILLRHYQKRRRLEPEFYKKRPEHSSHAHHQSAQEEFSEIRYLTGEEHLDFSLAEPSTFRPTVKPALNAVHPGIGSDCGACEIDQEAVPPESGGKRGSRKAMTTNEKRDRTQKKSYRKDAADNEGLLKNDFDDDEEEDSEEW